MKTIIKIILLAAISAALAIVVEQLIAAMASAYWQKEVVLDSFKHFTWFLAVSAIVEEVSKFWAVYFVIHRKIKLEKIKLILASFFFGAVWGLFELGLILFSDPNVASAFQAGNPEILFSFGSIIALHALTAFLMGILISANSISGKLSHINVMLFPILMHLLFNFLIVQKGDFTNYLVIISLSITFLAGIIVFAFNFRKLA